MPTLREYVATNGQNHYRQFFLNLSTAAAAKVSTVIARLASGHTSGLKSLGGGVAEWKLDWGPGYRIYVHQDGSELVILLAGSEKLDQHKTIALATELVDEYKDRKKAEAEAKAAAAKAAAKKAEKGGKKKK